jgi:hypothetical protein
VAWLIQNASTIIAVAVLVAVVAMIILGMIKDKRQGKHSCGSSCSCCPMSGKCHPDPKEKSEG